MGLDVEVIFLSIKSFKYYFTKKRILKKFSYTLENNLKVYRIEQYTFIPKSFETRFYKKKYIKSLKGNFRKIYSNNLKPDIIHAHSFIYSGIATYYISQEQEIPFVVTEHSSRFSRRNYKRHQIKSILKASYGSKLVIAVSNGLKLDLLQLGIARIMVIPNMVNNKFIENYNTKSLFRKNNFVFFTLANLVPHKKIDILLKSFKFGGFDDCKLIIGGDGPQKKHLVTYVKENNLTENIIFLGRISRERTIKEMRNCDVFILVSSHETFGIVFIEALASGKPIIASASGGPDDLVTKENGILVSVNNINETINSMKYIKENYKLYNQKVIREKAIQKYSPMSVVKQILEIYKYIMKNKEQQ